ncbi:hypothetical protein N0V88_007196 [Collariella sp. IMI 366227]|nr:hypothetical protein N0V88_007196 [Collariella sp. IMI 366227]
MAPVYADHPFALLSTPNFQAKNNGTKPDMFDNMASEMCNVHNMIIRGLNSIYLQAPYITPADEKPFARYMTGWWMLLHAHHSGEEALFFPTVERLTGVKGIMDANIEQHKAFHDGLDKFKTYADSVVAGKEKFDGGKVVEMVDAFGPVLMTHLGEEIPTILGLRKYADRLEELPRLFEEEGEKAMKAMGVFGMVWCFANLDIHFENDLWTQWPPAPAPVKVLTRSVFWLMNADARKFGAADRTGNMRHLYAVPQST